MGIFLSQAIDGFVLECGSRRLSENTIASYVSVLGKLQRSLPDDPALDSITPEILKRFLVETRGPGGAKLSNKTVLNYHICLSALWTWALAEGHVARHVVHDIPKPKAEKPAISPMTEDDVRRLLGSLERSRRYKRPGKQICDNRRLTAARDRAIILMLLDAGLRASELCDMKIKDVDVRNQRAYVWGKGSRERVMPLSAATTKAIWRYLQTERSQARIADPLFVQRDDASQKMNRTALRQLLVRIGERAGVRDCHPHRFRHTFAISCLRNGMNAYALQMALGHSTMEMVRVYLEIAQADLDAAHRQASPVANWGL